MVFQLGIDDDEHAAGVLFEPVLLKAQMAQLAMEAKMRVEERRVRLEGAAAVLRDLVLQTPPNAGGGWGDWWKALQFGRQLHSLPVADLQVLTELFTQSAGELLDRWFEHPLVKAAFAFDGIVGTLASPSTPGTAYVLLHHCFGEVNGKSGVWGHAVGGMGAITQAMAKAAQAAGAEIRTGAQVARVNDDGSKVTGLTLLNGDVVRAGAVAANIPPKLLFRAFLSEAIVAPELRERFAAKVALRYKAGKGSVEVRFSDDDELNRVLEVMGLSLD